MDYAYSSLGHYLTTAGQLGSELDTVCCRFTIFTPINSKDPAFIINTHMKRILICLLFSVSLSAYAQNAVVINPDGTHSVIVNNGSVSTVVNPDGTHSTAIMNGNSTTVVNPDGTHSVIVNNGNVSTVVNPDGTHSTVIMTDNDATIVNQTERPLWQIFKLFDRKKNSKKHDQKHTETDFEAPN